MPAKFEGLLDQGQMEDVNLKSAVWKPVRTSKWNLECVRPEFLSLGPTAKPQKPIRSTAWLDGLRGFAAFMVYIHHNQLFSHGLKGGRVFENSFGYEGHHYFGAFHGVRLFFAGGHFAVAIFFVISGYVLSLKPLSLIQKNQSQTAIEGVGSALFRRWIRLFLPVIATTFVWVCLRHATKIPLDEKTNPPLKSTFWAELVNWYQTFKNYSFVFSTNYYDFTQTYQGHLWSIPIEFKGSIIIYTALSAFSKCTRNARLWCQVGLIFYFLYIADGYYGSLFITGMMLCDLELLSQDDQLPRWMTKLAAFKEFIFFHLFIAALYLGGVPSFETPTEGGMTVLVKSPGWKWLSRLKPQAVFDHKWFYLYWAALFTVASIPRLPWLKKFFETRFCQYLARISFALYLVHGPIIFLLADRLYAAVGMSRPEHQKHIPGWINKFPLPKNGPIGFEVAFWASQVIIMPVTFFVAELVTKFIDEPSVQFANWLYKKSLAPPQTPKR